MQNIVSEHEQYLDALRDFNDWLISAKEELQRWSDLSGDSGSIKRKLSKVQVRNLNCYKKVLCGSWSFHIYSRFFSLLIVVWISPYGGTWEHFCHLWQQFCSFGHSWGSWSSYIFYDSFYFDQDPNIPENANTFLCKGLDLKQSKQKTCFKVGSFLSRGFQVHVSRGPQALSVLGLTDILLGELLNSKELWQSWFLFPFPGVAWLKAARQREAEPGSKMRGSGKRSHWLRGLWGYGARGSSPLVIMGTVGTWSTADTG